MLSAGEHLQRAGVYYHFAKFLFVHDAAQSKAAHGKAIECLTLALPHLNPPGERVAIPYEGKHLYGILRKPKDIAKPPVMLMACGLDSTKEETDAYEQPFLARGIAILVFDGPGQGKGEYDFAIRGDYEIAVKVVIDFVETRNDLETARIGMWGVSLGGYYAPRAAAFEKRIAACIAWGAIWDFGKSFHDRLVAHRKTFDYIPDMVRQAMWVFSEPTPEGVLDVTGRMQAASHAWRIACPFLILHGENNRQVPVSDAEALHDAAAASPDRTLRIVRLEEGGAEHCNTNNLTVAGDVMADWAARVLGGAPNGAL